MEPITLDPPVAFPPVPAPRLTDRSAAKPPPAAKPTESADPPAGPATSLGRRVGGLVVAAASLAVGVAGVHFLNGGAADPPPAGAAAGDEKALPPVPPIDPVTFTPAAPGQPPVAPTQTPPATPPAPGPVPPAAEPAKPKAIPEPVAADPLKLPPGPPVAPSLPPPPVGLEAAAPAAVSTRWFWQVLDEVTAPPVVGLPAGPGGLPPLPTAGLPVPAPVGPPAPTGVFAPAAPRPPSVGPVAGAGGQNPPPPAAVDPAKSPAVPDLPPIATPAPVAGTLPPAALPTPMTVAPPAPPAAPVVPAAPPAALPMPPLAAPVGFGAPAEPAPAVSPAFTPAGGTRPAPKPAAPGEPQPAAVESKPAESPPQKSFDVDVYYAKAGDQYEAVSREFYGDPKYAAALTAFNQNRPLRPNQPVEVPPVHILQRRYGQPAGGAVVVPAAAGGWAPAGSGAATAGEPDFRPAGRGRTFVVPAGGLSMHEVARRELGDERRWREVYELNKGYDTRAVPAGAKLALPSADPPR